jgi:4-hydroxy-tetrahydrodipicolinate reductase
MTGTGEAVPAPGPPGAEAGPGPELRVAVVGAGGRMGAEVCRAVSAAPDLRLVAAIDPAVAGAALDEVVGVGVANGEPGGLVVASDLEAIEAAGATVVVDFTGRDAARLTLAWCATRGVHVVVGTTGLDAVDLDGLGRSFPAAGGVGCVVAPNFAIGAVLMMRFAELAAPWFETAEIIELHHDAKRDAPSGTAMLTAERMGAARRAADAGEWGADPTRTEVVAGARGGLGPDGIRMHSVRLRGLVAHQEVLLGTAGQGLTIRHDSYDRTSFMPGVLVAVRAVSSHPGLTVGLDTLLGL